MSIWTPEVWGTGAKPGGNRDLQLGVHTFVTIEDEPDYVRCQGFASVRLDGDVDRGEGFIRLDMPFEPFHLEGITDPWYLLGTVTLGFVNWQHRSLLGLHRNGMTDPAGKPDGAEKAAVIAPDGLLFVDENTPLPTVDIVDFHWDFDYVIERPV